jgi:hypothetical protein
VPSDPLPPCIDISDEDAIIASAFESLDYPMKHKKEGDTYYFYPRFFIAFGVYAICSSNSEANATDCLNAAKGAKDGGNLSVPITILGESCTALRLYTKIYTDTSEPGVYCTKSGKAYVSSLQFT